MGPTYGRKVEKTPVAINRVQRDAYLHLVDVAAGR